MCFGCDQTKERSGTYILMEARLVQLFKNEEDYDVLAKYKGKQLEGIRYTPLFSYFKEVQYVICLTLSLLNLSSSFQALCWMCFRDCLVSAQFLGESEGVQLAPHYCISHPPFPS